MLGAKIFSLIGVAIAFFVVGVVAFAQTATPGPLLSPMPSPTSSNSSSTNSNTNNGTSVPRGAPSTGFGGGF